MDGGRSLTLRGDDFLGHLVGNIEEQFGLKRRNRVEKAFSFDLIGKDVGDGAVHPVQVVQSIGILGFGEPTDDEGSGITGRQVFDLTDPLNELTALLVAGFLGGILRGHVVNLYVGRGLFEMKGGGLTVRVLESGLQIDARFGPASMAFGAVVFDEWLDLVLQNLLGIGPTGVFVRRGSLSLRQAGHEECNGEEKGYARKQPLGAFKLTVPFCHQPFD